MEIKRGYGPYLRAARETAGLTQREMALWLSVDQATISRMELGITCPTVRQVRNWFDVLGGNHFLETWHKGIQRIRDMLDLAEPEILLQY